MCQLQYSKHIRNRYSWACGTYWRPKACPQFMLCVHHMLQGHRLHTHILAPCLFIWGNVAGMFPGNEFSTVCGPQCVRENQFSKGRTVFQNEVKRTTTCYVCNQKNISNSFQLLHIPMRKVQLYHLCSKHNMAPSIIHRLGDESDLVMALKINKKLSNFSPWKAQSQLTNKEKMSSWHPASLSHSC